MTHPSDDDHDDHGLWQVLVNTRGQHALWPAGRPVPAGWTETGPEGAREDCLAWIDQHWTDLRPQRAPASTTATA